MILRITIEAETKAGAAITEPEVIELQMSPELLRQLPVGMIVNEAMNVIRRRIVGADDAK